MGSKRSTDPLDLATSLEYIERPKPYNGRTYDRRFIPQTWNAFQRMRLGNSSVLLKPQGSLGVAIVNEMPTSHESVNDSTAKRKNSKQPSANVHYLPQLKQSTSRGRWARSWANHRAQQALLTRNSVERLRSTASDDRRCGKSQSANIPLGLTRSHCIELDAKAAAVFGRLKSIYINEEERDRRLQSIRNKMNECQKKSIRKEVNKSIKEFNKRLKEDEKNRRELRRVREKFNETKNIRLKKMHVSLNALEGPSVSRLAYGLPQDGKEFSAPFSSKKTTDEIKNLWRTAFVRKKCIDSFLSKVSGQKHHNLPEITIKARSGGGACSTRSQETGPALEKAHTSLKSNYDTGNSYSSEDKLSKNNMVKLQSGILESFESWSSEEDDD